MAPLKKKAPHQIWLNQNVAKFPSSPRYQSDVDSRSDSDCFAHMPGAREKASGIEAAQVDSSPPSLTSVPGEPGSLTAAYLAVEWDHAAHNYDPIRVVIETASGCYMTDVEGKQYLDCLSAYSSVSQGHCHPRIVKALCEQAAKVTLTSRAFLNDKMASTAAKLTHLLGYHRAMFMNTGAEAVETAIKLARRWAVNVKGVENDRSVLIFASNNFHGRTTGIISASTCEYTYSNFGPLMPGIVTVPYGDKDILCQTARKYKDYLAGVFLEPIQGEAGVVVPPPDYLLAARVVCNETKSLLIVDEIQTGLGRTGAMLCQDHSGVKADIVTLGKSLGGGVYAVSAVLTRSPCNGHESLTFHCPFCVSGVCGRGECTTLSGDERTMHDLYHNDIMLQIKPGEHGSTYGGNPLAMAVADASLDVIVDEGLVKKAAERGDYLEAALNTLSNELEATTSKKVITNVRGKGLLWGVVLSDDILAKDVCNVLKSKGVLASPTQKHVVRIAPPLIITEEQIDSLVHALKSSLEEIVVPAMGDTV